MWSNFLTEWSPYCNVDISLCYGFVYVCVNEKIAWIISCCNVISVDVFIWIPMTSLRETFIAVLVWFVWFGFFDVNASHLNKWRFYFSIDIYMASLWYGFIHVTLNYLHKWRLKLQYWQLWLLFGMDSFMPLHGAWPSEAFIAVLTFIWLLFGMYSFMFLQVTWLSETFITVLTFIWLLYHLEFLIHALPISISLLWFFLWCPSPQFSDELCCVLVYLIGFYWGKNHFWRKMGGDEAVDQEMDL